MYGKKYNLFNWTKPMVILLMISGSHQKQQQWQQHTKTQTNKQNTIFWLRTCMLGCCRREKIRSIMWSHQNFGIICYNNWPTLIQTPHQVKVHIEVYMKGLHFKIGIRVLKKQQTLEHDKFFCERFSSVRTKMFVSWIFLTKTLYFLNYVGGNSYL